MITRIGAIALLLFAMTALRTHAQSGFSVEQDQTLQNGLALAHNLITAPLVWPAMSFSSTGTTPGMVADTHCSYQLVNGQYNPVQVTISFDTSFRFTASQVVHEVIHALQCFNPSWVAAENNFAWTHPIPNVGLGTWFNEPNSCTCMNEYTAHVIQALYDGGRYADFISQYPDIVRFSLQHMQ